jgi:hypothetical protein
MKLYNVARMADDTLATDVLSPHHTHPIGQVLMRARTKKLTVGEVSERLAKLGFTIVGEYVNTRTRCRLKCESGHEWLANIGNVLKTNGTGCPHCRGIAQLTVQEIEKRLTPRGIKMLGEEHRSVKRAVFKCTNNHTWVARIGSVLFDTGCPQCRSNRPLTRDEVNARISERSYTLAGEYCNAGTSTEFECSEGHRWMAIPDNVLRGKGCPSCADYGFNPEHPACFYTIHIFSDTEEYIGFGITKDAATRFSYHARAIKNKGFGFKILDMVEFKSGHDAQVLEDLVKENMTVVDTGIKGFRKEAIHANAYVRMQDLVRAFTS